MKNITNGQFKLIYSLQDRIAAETKLTRLPPCDILTSNLSQSSCFYIQNIRTGQFSSTSQSHFQQTSTPQQPLYTTFESELAQIAQTFQSFIIKFITLFQGLFTGMALLFTITLNLSTVSSELVRVQDQAIRVVSLLSTFGAFYGLQLTYKKKTEESSKAFWLALVETLSNISFIKCILAVTPFIMPVTSMPLSTIGNIRRYNVLLIDYNSLQKTTAAYTVLCIIAWITTNANTFKYRL